MKFNLALYDLFNTSIEEGVYDYPKRLSKAILDLKNTYTKLEGVLVLDGSSDLYEQDFRNAHKQKYSDGAYYASLAVDLVRKDVVNTSEITSTACLRFKGPRHTTYSI